MRYFTVPADFSHETIDRFVLLNQEHKDACIFETYGEMQSDSFFTSGRMSAPKVGERKLRDYVEYAASQGIQFNYVLNGSTMNNQEFTREGIAKIRDFVERLYQCGVKSFTVALFPIIEIIKSMNLDIELVVSTIAQVDNNQLAQFYDAYGVDRIVTSEKINRDFKQLKQIQSAIKSKVEVITNSLCFIYCPFRMMHYNQIAAQYGDRSNQVSTTYYQNRCTLRRTQSAENYLKLAFIRPEDVKYYEEIGIEYFKIQGRQAVAAGDIYRTARHYVEADFDGNLMELLHCFTSGVSDMYLNNKELDTFLTKFVQGSQTCQYGCGNCNYCRSFMEKSLKSSEQACQFINRQIKRNDLFQKMNQSMTEEKKR